MPGGAIQRAAADVARRLGLLMFAALLLVIAILFACAGMAVSLMQVMPLWAALAATTGAILLVCLLLVLLAARESRGVARHESDAAAPDAQAAAIGAMLGRGVRQRPKSSLLLALGAGLILGLNPGLRRELYTLLRDPPQR